MTLPPTQVSPPPGMAVEGALARVVVEKEIVEVEREVIVERVVEKVVERPIEVLPSEHFKQKQALENYKVR